MLQYNTARAAGEAEEAGGLPHDAEAGDEVALARRGLHEEGDAHVADELRGGGQRLRGEDEDVVPPLDRRLRLGPIL